MSNKAGELMHDMEVKLVAVDEIKEDLDNPRDILSTNAKILNQSIATFGLVETLVVDEDMNLISGHQRLNEAKNLGKTKVNVSIYRGDKKDLAGIALNHEAFEGEYVRDDFADMVQGLPKSPEFSGLHFDKTLRSGNAIHLGKEQIVIGTYRIQISQEEVQNIESTLSGIEESERANYIEERMKLWLKNNQL